MGIVITVLFASHYSSNRAGYNSGYKDAVNSITQDSVIIIETDTVFVAEYFPIYLEWEREADVDTVDDIITYSTHIDTTVIIEQDTVALISQDISFTEGIFKILMDVEIRPIKETITIDKIIFQTVEVPVPANPPFYQKFTFGFVTGILLMLLTIIFL